MFPLSPHDNLVCWFGLLSRGARSFVMSHWLCVSSLSAKTVVSQAILKSQFSAGSMVKPEANSSIEYFNDNDETVLQGETQYKYAE